MSADNKQDYGTMGALQPSNGTTPTATYEMTIRSAVRVRTDHAVAPRLGYP